jgi:hypothetical protein
MANPGIDHRVAAGGRGNSDRTEWSGDMKIVRIGGGPARLYFAISTETRDADHDITAIERDPTSRGAPAAVSESV